MSKVFFVNECPTCGRYLHIRVEYLGKRVVCPHCGGKFDAVDLAVHDLPVSDSVHSLMQRVDELLEVQVNDPVNSDRLPHPR